MLLSGELEISADKHEHAAEDRRRLAVDGRDGVLALLEWQLCELPADPLHAYDLLSLEGQHRAAVVEAGEGGAVGVEEVVVVVHECLGHHLQLLLHRPLLVLPVVVVHGSIDDAPSDAKNNPGVK